MWIQAFFIPGSLDGSANETENENLLQWNKVTPPLFLWSRGDMIRRHKEIALSCQHIRGSRGDISGSQGRVPPPPAPPPPPTSGGRALLSPSTGHPGGKCYPILPGESVPPPPPPHIPGGMAIPVQLQGRAPVPPQLGRAKPLSPGQRDSSSAASSFSGWKALSPSGERMPPFPRDWNHFWKLSLWRLQSWS